MNFGNDNLVITFGSDKPCTLVDIRQRRLDGNTRGGREEETSVVIPINSFRSLSVTSG
jgi:hypothetical protein